MIGKLGTVELLKKSSNKCCNGQPLETGGCFSSFPVLTINVQPVENRRQLVGGKGAPPQHGSRNAEDSRSSGLGVSRSSRESNIETIVK